MHQRLIYGQNWFVVRGHFADWECSAHAVSSFPASVRTAYMPETPSPAPRLTSIGTLCLLSSDNPR